MDNGEIADPEGTARKRLVHKLPAAAGPLKALAFSTLLAALATLLWLGPLAPLGKVAGPWNVAPPLLAVIFFVVHTATVRVHFRRTGAMISAGEIAMVIGLVGAAPRLMLGTWLGVIFLSAFLRGKRWTALQIYFNLSMHAFTTGCMVGIFRILVDQTQLASSNFLTVNVLIALLASQIPAVATSLLIPIVIWLYEGELEFRGSFRQLELSAIGLPINTSIGIILLVLLRWAPLAAAMFALPLAVIIASFKIYDEQRRRHDELNFLHDISQLLQSSTNVRHVTHALLTQMRDVFYAADVSMIIVDSDDRTHGVRFEASAEAQPAPPTWVAVGDAELAATPLNERSRRFGVLEPRVGPEMVAQLHDERAPLGMIRITGRSATQMGGFRLRELRLLGGVAAQVSVAIERGLVSYNLTQMKAERDKATYDALHDGLTGLANRTLFSDRLQQALERFARDGQPVGLVFIDLNDFKGINDTYGHAAGDQVLCEMAEALRAASRQQDTVARLGGDEFAAVLIGLKDADEAKGVGERIVTLMDKTTQLDGHTVKVSASVGVATISTADKSITSAEFLQRADSAMYLAKRHKGTGQRPFAVFSGDQSVAVTA